MIDMTIRPALDKDVPRLHEMAFRFLGATPYGNLIEGVTVHSMQAFIELVMHVGTVIVAETEHGVVGMLGVVLVQHPISGRPEAAEVAWWVEPEHRTLAVGAKLLESAEAWARHRGATCLKMVAPAGSRTGAFYTQHGYVEVETTYQKSLSTSPARRAAGNGHERGPVWLP